MSSERPVIFSFFAFGQQRAARRVDDLGEEVVFPHGEPVLGLGALLRHAGADQLRQAVVVERFQAEALLDRAAHFVGPGLGAEQADAQRRLRRIDALALHLVGDRQHVRGRDRPWW